MKKRLVKLFRIIKYAIISPKYLLLYLMRAEAEDYLDTFHKMGIGCVEEVEDLIYHIDSYIELPKILQNTKYVDYLKNGEKLDEYIEDLETYRAVEREYIFEALKKLSIGFQL